MGCSCSAGRGAAWAIKTRPYFEEVSTTVSPQLTYLLTYLTFLLGRQCALCGGKHSKCALAGQSRADAKAGPPGPQDILLTPVKLSEADYRDHLRGGPKMHQDAIHAGKTVSFEPIREDQILVVEEKHQNRKEKCVSEDQVIIDDETDKRQGKIGELLCYRTINDKGDC